MPLVRIDATSASRDTSVRQAFYIKAAELVEARTQVEPRNLFIVMSENQSADWSLGNGVAQYLLIAAWDAYQMRTAATVP